MKKLSLSALLLLFCIVSFAQEAQFPINPKTNKIEYTAIVNVDSTVTSDELYTRARSWFATAFKSANNVIQMDDRSTGTIIGKGNFAIRPSTYQIGSRISFTIKIQVKNGRYRYLVNDLSHTSPHGDGGNLENEKPAWGWAMMKRAWVEIKDNTSIIIPEFIASLNEQMKKPLSSKTESW